MTTNSGAASSRALSAAGALIFGMGAGAYLHRVTDSWPLLAWLFFIVGGAAMLAGLLKR